MKKRQVENIAPVGYSRVCPYLMVVSVEEELDFLRKVFSAEIIEELKNPDGSIVHGEARIGDSVIMVGKSREDQPANQSMIYVFVEDVEVTYLNALSNGCDSLMKPEMQFYGFLEAGVKDNLGNQWWMAKQVETVSQKEIEKRMNELKDNRDNS